MLNKITTHTTNKSSNMSWSIGSSSVTTNDHGISHTSGHSHGHTNRSTATAATPQAQGNMGNMIPVVPTANIEVENQKRKLTRKHYRL